MASRPPTALFPRLRVRGSSLQIALESGVATCSRRDHDYYDFSRATTAGMMIPAERARRTVESVSRRADYILTYPALQRGRPTPSRLRVHATAGPRAIHGGLRHVADVPTFAGIPAHDFRYGHAHALPCAAVVIYAAIPYPSTFGFRTSLNQERSERRLTREQSTREGAPRMPEVLLDARRSGAGEV